MQKIRKTWTNKELEQIHQWKAEGKTWKEMSEILKTKSSHAIERKYMRVDWDKFSKDPQNYLSDIKSGKWLDEEMIQLDAYIQSGKSYCFISEKIGRSITSVERQAQNTDWDGWRMARKNVLDSKSIEAAAIAVKEDKNSAQEQMVSALLHVCRNEFKRVEAIKESEFLSRVNLEKENMGISFSDLKGKAKNRLIEFGHGNPENIEFGKGRYVIIGDSHGKETKKDMFNLIEKINTHLKPDKIIHIGHILDEDGEISYDWGRFKNLIILSKVEELRKIQGQRNAYNFDYKIVLESVLLGKDLFVLNQDLITDYVKTPISSLDSEIMDDRVIVNCHRMELTTRCSNDSSSYFASPGCICDEHINKTVKQIDFHDGKSVKVAYPESFIKYRRMRHMKGYWEQGLLVVEVDNNGDHTLIPCQIKKTSKGYTTSYFDKIITSQGVFNPDRKIFVNGDMHCDMHDINALDIQEQICKNYKPDVQVNVGDTFNYASLNHHVMDRGGVILDKKLLDEAASTHYILKRVLGWAKESHLIYGNHERFAKDFVEKYPQFGDMLDFNFLCDLKNMGYKLTPLKSVLKIGSVKFLHGEVNMFGQNGSKLEKVSRTFSKDCFIGHIHRPEIRFGVFSVPMSGLLSQIYNENEASNWMHGFGLCNQFAGQNFLTTIAIDDYKCAIGGKSYYPINTDSWKYKKYTARLSYDFGK